MSQARPSGIGAADPAWPRCCAANCASPAEPARITSGDAMPAAASASRSASVSASAAMMPPAARPSAAREGRAAAAHALERQVAHGPRGAAAQDLADDRGVAGIRGVAPDRRGVGGAPVHAQHAAGDGAALGGEARAHERRRPPRHLEEGLDLRGDGAAERGVDLLEDESGADPGAEVTGHGAHARSRLGRREGPAFGVDDRDLAGGIDARRVHEHADPAASREMRARIASSGQVVGDERDGHAPLEANTGGPDA